MLNLSANASGTEGDGNNGVGGGNATTGGSFASPSPITFMGKGAVSGVTIGRWGVIAIVLGAVGAAAVM